MLTLIHIAKQAAGSKEDSWAQAWLPASMQIPVQDMELPSQHLQHGGSISLTYRVSG